MQPAASTAGYMGAGGRKLLDVGVLSTTEFIIAILCSVIGFLLVLVAVVLIVMACK